MPFPNSRSPKVGVQEAQAFIEKTRRVDAFSQLVRGWSGQGSLPVRAPTVSAARRLLQDRQTMAERFEPKARTDGTIVLEFKCGTASDQGKGWIHIDAAGRPAILRDLPGESDEANATRHPSVSAKAFRKGLDDLVSPRTGRIKSRKVEIDGMIFDSDIEGKRYLILKSDERTGRISDLRMQVKFTFDENGIHCFTYIADFVYQENGAQVVEDVKGMRTDVYRIKKKLIEARYGFRIQEWPIPKKELLRRAAAEDRARKAEADRIAKNARRIERAAVAHAKAVERAEAVARRAAARLLKAAGK